MTLLLTVVAAGVLTYATRLSFIVAHGRVELPRWFTHALAFVPVAVLSAIIFPELLAAGGSLDLSFGNARLLAGLVATGIAWWTKSIWLTIAAGMIVVFALQAMW